MLQTPLVVVALCLLLSSAAWGQPPAGSAPDGDRFVKDLSALTAAPHRLAGSQECNAASRYVQQRLEEMGVEEIYVQNFTVPFINTLECALEADGKSYPIYALRPNHLQPVATPAEGLTGRCVYAGGGALAEYAGSPREAIVVLDFSAGDRWLEAFGMGAKAVVFIGQEAPAPNAFHHVNFPANLPRFYVPAELAGQLELKSRLRPVTLKAASRWEMRQGRNVIGVIRGANPKFEQSSNEAVLLSAPLDALSEVPLLSNGARQAANCAGLLTLAEHLLANRPRRDVIVAFFDGEAWDHAGAKAFYGALYRDKGKHHLADGTLAERLKMLQDEQEYLGGIQQVLDVGNIFSPEAGKLPEQRSAKMMMRRQAKALSGNVRDELQLARTRRLQHEQAIRALRPGLATSGPAAPGWDLDREAEAAVQLHEQAIVALEGQIGPLIKETEYWSQLERSLYDPRQEAGAKYAVVLGECQRLSRARQDELAALIEQGRQGQRLSDAIGDSKDLIVLHLSLNLGDQSPRWTFIHGYDCLDVHNNPDRQGLYAGIFQGIRQVAKSLSEDRDVSESAGTGKLEGGIRNSQLGAGDANPESRIPNTEFRALKLFESRTVEGILNVRMFAPGLFASSGSAAGLFGVSNLSLMTPMDRRPRDGQPCDVVFRRTGLTPVVPEPVLQVANMQAALREIRPFVERLCNSEAFSLTSGINPLAKYTEVGFSGGKYAGASALMLSASSAMPDRAALGAFVAVMRRPGRIWDGAWLEATPPGFTPFALAQVDTNGRLELPPLSSEYYKNSLLVGAMHDGRGLIDYISNTRTVSFSMPLTGAGTIMFRATGMTVVGQGFDRGAIATRALKASSTAPLSDDRSLVVESGNVVSVYALRSEDMLKLFNPDGTVVLGNAPPADPVLGRGLALEPYAHWPTAELAAHDLHRLNEARLDILKNNRILEPSLERLHAQALEIRQQALASPPEQVERHEPTMAASAAVSRRVYKPLLGVLNDLVLAVVLLLLLAIPFAYALERLLVGTPHIYRQIGWFVAFFLATFALLYFVNPAFRIAATPIVIFLAFAIILLSGLVIVIMTRKLQAEVKRMQGLGTTVHSSDVSRLGTMMAAVHMGISTMRRRPIRTLLTAVTVVLLTFTILTFASFGSSWGNRRTYIAPVSGPPRVLVRHPLWTRISEQIPQVLAGYLQGRAQVVPLYWVSQTAGEMQEYVAAGRTKEIMLGDAGGRNVVGISALVGLDLRDVRNLPELSEVLVGDSSLLAADGVFLTAPVADRLEVKPGDVVNVDGLSCRLAGIIDLRRMTGYRLLEGSSMLPVDYQASGGGNAAALATKESAALEDMPEMESAQFITFSADRTAIIPAHLARQLGGRVACITVYPASTGVEREAASGFRLQASGTTTATNPEAASLPTPVPPDVEQLAGQVATVTGLPTYAGARGGVYRLFFTSLTEASGWRDLVIPVVLGGLIIFATMLGSVSDREKEIYAFSALGLAPPHIASLFFAEAGVYAVVGGMGGYLLGQAIARTLSWVSETFGILSVPTMNYSSTNAIATVLVVMCTVLVSTIYPAVKASRSANPGIQRSWRIGKPQGELYDIVFPFTVSAYDITGVVSFLREHFENYSDTALGVFATSSVHVFRQPNGLLGVQAEVALAPFDLGVSQKFALLARPSEIEGIQEIRILLYRLSGTGGDWQRANRVFIHELRKQLLIWRAVSAEVMEKYRQMTLTQWERLPVQAASADMFAAPGSEAAV